MNSALPDPVAFLSSGLVHQFGNLLFTIQGHAVVLDGDSLERGRTAITAACARGAACLQLFRHLLGEPGSSWLPAADATGQLLELMRVPVREAGHTLDHRCPGGAGGKVELGAFVPALVGAVQAVLTVVPHGVTGHIHVVVATDGTHAHVAVTFRTPSGSLPFPLAIDAAAATVRHIVAAERHGVRVLGHGTTLEVAVPTVSDAMQA
ncbi:MAG: hypothetical protein JNK15_02965 [Planctomycetes bacterium]|nr:hypothetical protein [Planctomycetota bacterium]